MERRHKIAVIPGDGIGPEVIEGAVVVLKALMRVDPDLKLDLTRGEVGEPAYEKYGNALPEESLELIRKSKAVLFGAVGELATHVVLPLRQQFDLFANVRPAYTFEGVPALQKKVDIVIVRENTEDVYKGIGYSIDDTRTLWPFGCSPKGACNGSSGMPLSLRDGKEEGRFSLPIRLLS
jgi:isocitrate/isopropylmalate dehydrogenase